MQIVLETSLPDLLVKRGKVRDIYDLGNKLLIVTTDRISAFDRVMPNGIPRKGEILTALSTHWFKTLDVFSHFISSDFDEILETDGVPRNTLLSNRDVLEKRTMLVNKYIPLPVECIVRGYLAGSAWKEYQKTGQVCGVKLPAGLKENFPLPEPIFTPTTKAESGHDENITFEQMIELLNSDEQSCEDIRDASVHVYKQGASQAFANGIIVADTKLEWALFWDTSPVLIDEVLTPDSSRFWAVDRYKLSGSVDSFDKQYVRDYLSTTDWDMECGAPFLPQSVVEMTTKKYLEAYKALTGKEL